MKLKPHLIKLASATRLHNLEVPVIGLTGGIATGKSTVSRILQKKGLPIIDADQLVKSIYAQPETIQHMQKLYPEVVDQGMIQFPQLRELFFQNEKVKSEIEQYIYRKLPSAFREAYHRLGDPAFVVYDVPLLFEKKLEQMVDVSLVVYAPRKVQLARLMKRDGHLEEMALTILSHQMDIEDKKLKADYLINNSQTETELELEINQFLQLATI